MAKRLRQIAHPSGAILHCRSSLLRYKVEPQYSYRTSNLFFRRVVGRAVRRVRSKKIFGPAQVAFLFSASMGVVRNRRCLLRDRLCLRVSNSRTSNDDAISKPGIDAPPHYGGSKCSLECVIFSGKKSWSHFHFFNGLFDRCYRLLVLLVPVRHSCGICFRSICSLPPLRERLGIPGVATK